MMEKPSKDIKYTYLRANGSHNHCDNYYTTSLGWIHKLSWMEKKIGVSNVPILS